MSERFPIVGYHWADPDHVVHELSDVIENGYVVERLEVASRTGECRTTCGIRLSDDRYYFTRNAISCTWCIVGEFAGWRSIANR